MFSTVHHGPHSQKKRTVANIYSKSYIQSSPQIAANSRTLLSARFLPLIHSTAESCTPVDVHDLNNAFTMDFMSAYQFGIQNSTNFTQDVATRQRLLHEYHSRRDYEIYSSELPLLKRWSRRLGLPVVPKFVDDANQILEDWGSSMCKAADDYLKYHAPSHDSSQPFNPGNEPIVYKQFKHGLSRLREKDPFAGMELLAPSEKLGNGNGPESTMLEIQSEMLDHLGAGHETSAVALTYLYWELSKQPAWQAELRKELLTLSPQIIWPVIYPDTITLPEPKDIDKLPFLHAIFMETLRLHASIPGIEPRVSPAGLHTLGAYDNIPGGVRVSSMPFALHRNASVFPEPEMFKPSRWLSSTSSETQLKEMHRWFWAFGSGGRMCIGSNLATQEIKLIVAAIYSNYTTEIVDDEGIEELDAYTTRPKSNQLILKFKHV